MALSVKLIRGGNIQVENDAGNWLIFTLDELRSRSTVLRVDMIEGSPKPSEKDGDLFVWAAFAAARGFAIEHGLIESA